MSLFLPKANFVPTKKQLQIIHATAERWGKTLFEAQTPDLGRVKYLLAHGYANRRDQFGESKKPPRVCVVYSPLAFFIAQAVIRGVLSKEKAAQVLKDYGVEPDPVLKQLRRDTLAPLTDIKTPSPWDHTTSPTERLWNSTFAPIIKIAMRQFAGDILASTSWRLAEHEQSAVDHITKKLNFTDLPQIGRLGFDEELVARSRAASEELTPWSNNTINRWQERYLLFNNDLYGLTSNGISRVPVAGYDDIGLFSRIVNHAKINYAHHIYYTGQARKAIMSRTALIDPTNFYAYSASNSIIDVEAIAKIMGIKTPAHTWYFEILHEASAVMTFNNSALVLVGRPTIQTNEENELHCNTGPAVEWEDGASLYFIDGHPLGWAGRTAICAPEKLTANDINMQTNEETRRLLIERLGWDKYLTQVNAKVIDRRENWVDNTIELLIEFEREILNTGVTSSGAFPTRPDRRLVLACRSTGRKYFISVPDTITSCEQGQTWLADGAQTKELPALRHSINVIGAS